MTQAQRKPLAQAALVLSLLWQPSCAEVLGLKDRPVDDGTGGSGGGGSLCTPGATEQCSYSGPAGTNGVGACKTAKRKCNEDGSAWSSCEGEVTPSVEMCNTAADDDCDGKANEADAGCACIPGAAMVCYSGPMGTADVGLCKTGEQACNADGLSYGPCKGQVLPVVEDCTKKGDEDCSGLPCSDTLWSKLYGDGADQNPRDVAIDAQGNVFVIGGFTGSLTFDAFPLISAKNDIFLVKLDPAGKAVWAKRLGNADYQQPVGIALDKDGNVLVAGLFKVSIDLDGTPVLGDGGAKADAFLAKFDSDGKRLWSKPLWADDSISVYDIDTDPAGDVVVGGGFLGTLDLGGASVVSTSGSDAFVAKFSGDDGTALWGKAFGGVGYQVALQARTDVSGNIVLAGQFGGAISFDPDSYTAGAGEIRTFIARLDSAGTSYSSMEIAGKLGFPSVAVAPSGDILVAAPFSGAMTFGGSPITANGSFDIFVGSIDLGGNASLLKQLGGSSLINAGEADEFQAIVQTDKVGKITIATRAKGTINFGKDLLGSPGVANIFVAKLEPDGQHLWSKAFGPVDDAGACFTATAQDGTIALACGVDVASLDLGAGKLFGAGGSDVLVAKLAP